MAFSLKRFYEPSAMIKQSQVVGEIPSAKDMYSSTMIMAWPSMTESFLIALVSIIDTIMVSSLGETAIAAVGITGQPRLMVLSVFMALNTGIVAVVARRRGQNDRVGANRCLRQCLLIVVLLSILITSVAFTFSRELLVFAGAQPDAIEMSVTYFRIVLIGIPANIISLAINAAQRGSGNAKISMRTNVTANIVNCIFNYLLIGGNLGFPAWGIVGAAVATSLGSYVGMCMSIYSVMRKGGFLHLTLHESYIPDRGTMGSIIKVSSSAMVEQLFMRIGFFTYNKIVANLGTLDYATHIIGMNILTLSFSFGDGMTVAASALVGQNLGRKRPDLSQLYCKCTQRIGYIVAAVLSTIFVIFGDLILTLYTDDPYVMGLGKVLIYIIALIVVGQISQVIYSGCLRGAGDTKFTAITAMVSIACIRPTLSWLLCYPLGFGLYGAWIGVLIDQYLRLLLVGWRFGQGKWKNIEV